MFAEDLEWATETLVEAERRRCVSRVITVNNENSVSKGDNHGGVLQRLKMRVVLHSGEQQERWLIYKAIPDNPHTKKVIKSFGSFNKEAKMYFDVLSELEVILREKEPHAELLWPEFYGAKKSYEGLLLEDLWAKGFKMGNRQKGMNFDHAVLCLRSLSKFHALAAVLRERGDLSMKDFDLPMFANDFDYWQVFYQNSFEDLARVVETKWKGEWAQYGHRVRKALNYVISNIIKSIKRESTERFYTLNHGDCWLNNIMFRYGRKGEPEAVRFIDFQLCFYNHPGFDLQYFFQTSLDLETRPRKMELLQVYHSCLEENLKFFRYGGAVPTYADILECYKGAAYFGLATGVTSLPIMIAPSGHTPKIDYFIEKCMKNEEVKLSILDNEDEGFVNAIKYVLKEADDNGLF